MAVKNMNFEEALKCLKAKKKVRRQDWKDSLFVSFSKPPGKTGVLDGYFHMESMNGQRHGHFNPSKNDLLAEDWMVVDESV